MCRMSALSQAGSASESLKRVAFAAILYFAVGITVPIYAQQAPYAQESPTPGQAQREMQQRLERRRQPYDRNRICRRITLSNKCPGTSTH
jgi:hypothetical protein